MPSSIYKLAETGAQTMVEYAVVLGVITLAIVTAYGVMSNSIQGLFEQIVGVFS